MGDLFFQVKDSEALKTNFFLEDLHINHYVVQANYEELQRFLDAVESPAAVAQIWGREELYQALAETTRLLLNFLTSVSARTDCSRRMIRRRYEGKPFLETYEQEVKQRFMDNELAEFVEGLRNYSTHYVLPYPSAHAQFTGAQGRHFVALEKEGLLSTAGFDWRKKGKSYLEQADPEIIIREFTARYFEMIHDFQIWIEGELYKLHKEELDWLREADAKLQEGFARMRAEAERIMAKRRQANEE